MPQAKTASNAPKKEGSLRRGQIVSSFGPGSTIDLPDRSVIIGGLEYWRGWDRAPIVEPRLSEKAAQVLGVSRLGLYAPPVGDGTPGAAGQLATRCWAGSRTGHVGYERRPAPAVDGDRFTGLGT